MVVDNLTVVGVGVLTFVLGFYFGICLTSPRCDRQYGQLSERFTRVLGNGTRSARCGLCRWLRNRFPLVCAGFPCDHLPRPNP
jgi:hypothetical protein